MIKIDELSFGQHLKSIRKEKKLTLVELANLSGISQPHLSHIENGKRGIPPPDTLKKIAKGLDVDYRELMVLAGYIDEIERIDEETNKLEKEIEALSKYKDELELKSKLLESLKTQEKLLSVIRTMSDLYKVLISGSDVYFKDRLLTEDEKKKLLSIIEAFLN